MALARLEPDPVPASRSLRDLVRDLYVAHVDRVSNILRLRRVPKSEREDLVHEVFARVQEHWDKCRSQSAPRHWIEEIARNVEREHRRARRKDEVLVSDADVTTVAAPEADDEARQAARIDRVARLLTEIRDEERREIVTRRLEGQTNREIAEALNLQVGRVSKQYQRGYAELLAARDRHDARARHEAATHRHALVLPLYSTTSPSLFEGLLDEEKVPESFKARVWTRLQAHGGGGDGPAAPELPPAAPSVTPGSWAVALVAVGGVVAVVELVIILALLTHPPHESHAAPADVRPEATAAVVTSAPTPSSAPSPNAAAAPPSAPALPAFHARPARLPAPSDREHRFLDSATRALARRDGAAALAALDEHARAFPDSPLAEWRERMRTEALTVVQTGQAPR